MVAPFKFKLRLGSRSFTYGMRTNRKVVSEDSTYVGTALGPAFVKCSLSTSKVIKSVYVIVIKSARLDLTVELLDNAIGVLYSSS